MRIAFCTTCKGRLEHLQQTLPQNLAFNADYPDAVFIVLDYNSRDLEDYIKTTFPTELASGRLVFYQYKVDVAFRMAHAKNLAHRLGIREGADLLCNLDADNLTGPGFASYINENFTRTSVDPQEIYMWPRMLKGKLARGIGGRICVTKNAFLLSGGYDEKYSTHSPDDKDFNARLRRLGFCAQEIDPKYLLAINHNDRVRYREYPEVDTQTYEHYSICQISRVVNNGNIGTAEVFRNFSPASTIVDKVPTRIFGIGMHKTGTTSLGKALEILGYRSGHWINAHWAKAIWSDVTNLGRSIPLEQYYALSDLPFPLLFRQLDWAYPGSKFILTLRDESRWIRSVEHHFQSASNKYRAAWEEDPFTHKVHRLLYGQEHFDKQVFLARYRQHNAEVLEHFRNRPEALLIMNADTGDANFQMLCPFLGCPIPAEEYPKANVTFE